MAGEYWLPAIGREPRLRRDFLDYIDTMIAKENSLDKVSDVTSLAHQRGIISGLRFLRARVNEYPTEKEN